MKDIHAAKLYIMNNRELAGRAINYDEYAISEIKKNKEILDYLKVYGVEL